MNVKECSSCKITQDLANFYNYGNKCESKCKTCRNKQIRISKLKRSQEVKQAITEKSCKACKLLKPICEFYTSISAKDGYMNKCILCVNVYNKELIEKRKTKIQEPDKKICKQCNIEKPISNYCKLSARSDGRNQLCKDCRKLQLKKKEDEFFSMPTVNKRTCTVCNISKYLIQFRTNKAGNRYFKICKECWKPRAWSKEKQAIAERKYVENNPEKLKEKYKIQGQKLHRKIRARLNGRIKHALLRDSLNKDNRTFDYVGCNFEFLKKWFEYQFTEQINWDTIKDWQIDHVTPCTKYNLSERNEMLECFNWSNLRPCMKIENIKKGNKIIPELIEKQKQLAYEFLKINPLPSQPGDRVDGTE